MEYRQISDPSVKVSIVSTASVYGVQMHTLSNGDKWSEAAFNKEFVCADADLAIAVKKKKEEFLEFHQANKPANNATVKPVSLIKPILKGRV
jgi:hypothetical protein